MANPRGKDINLLACARGKHIDNRHYSTHGERVSLSKYRCEGLNMTADVHLGVLPWIIVTSAIFRTLSHQQRMQLRQACAQ
jgi:hypothetical protein